MPIVQPHPRFAEVRRLIAAGASLWQPWEGRVFRAVEIAWARPEYLVSGEGTRVHGGRWMRAGVAAVVHGASSEAIAIKESRRAFEYYGIRRPRNNPRVSVEIEVSLRQTLRLCPVEEVMPGFSGDEILAEDWEKLNGKGFETLAQAIGRAAWECRLEGLLVPSARDRRGRNLVWFPGNLGKHSVCRISGQADLRDGIADLHADSRKSD